ncbi:MAG: hypothetical protein VX874_03820 [Pseudomonadota bacterium]|nr:hypothetical protein [Pseudomonadota bacterium]
MRKLYRLIYRDRRRIAFTTLMLCAAWVVGSDTIPDRFVISGEAITILLLVAGSTAAAVAFPRHRFVIEIAAVSNFVFVALGRLFPGSNFNLANPELNFASSLLLYALLAVAFGRLATGHWSDTLPHIRRKTIARSYSTLSAKDLWYGLVPTPGHLDESPDPEVVSIDYADPSRRVVRLLNWLPPAAPSELLLHIEEIEPLNFVRLRVERIDPEQGGTLEGTTSFRIVDEGTRRRVEICHVADALPLRRQMRGWLDDTLGRWMDLRLTRVEQASARICETPGGVRYRRPADTASTDLFNSVYAKETTHNGPERRRAALPHWIAALPKTER